ncbi:MAG: hypothetical protein JNL01_12875 [Bdellovibrionales bacterium]|nr:hypothetical protein [Bdellovibrionales bacterium]
MNSFGTNLISFDMEQFIRNSFEGENISLGLLRKNGHWRHFVDLINHYQDRTRSTSKEMPSNDFNLAMLSLFGASQLNLVKGVKNVLGGHLSDSSIYVRRTIECFRYALCLRENPGMASTWSDPKMKKKFESDYREWFRKTGKELSKLEFKRNDQHFAHASNFGPHSNAQLAALQQQFVHHNDKIEYRILYTELDDGEPGYRDLLGTFFWHVSIHARALEWWMNKSLFVEGLIGEHLKYWTDSVRSLEKSERSARDFITRSLQGSGSTRKVTR